MNVYWLEQTEADVSAEDDWLSANEAARLSRLRFPKRRADWRLGRWTAKRAVSAYLKTPPRPPDLAAIEIRPAPSGAPEVFIANRPADCTVSISHRGGVAACAVGQAGATLGCDLELVEPRSEAFIADYFTPEEQALVAQSDAADRFRLVALLWSAKESALKALRAGLRLDTRSVIVTPGFALVGRTPWSARDAPVPLPEAGEAPTSGVSAMPMVAQAVPPASVTASTSPEPWHPLQIRHTDGQIFHGWWQLTGDLLRTVAADPRPNPPILVCLPLDQHPH